ncbi:MAG: hypothetical protein COV72_03185, partial [Candidatus Omnitrophica bacterium CG11_big_fil_rev_8_21_14_0_20_42_13]
RALFLVFAFFGFLFLGFLAYNHSNIVPKNHIKNITNIPKGRSSHVLVEGQVINRPDVKLTFFDRERSEFILKIRCIKYEGLWQTARGLLLTDVSDPRLNFKYGDEVVVEGDLSTPAGATNPGQFDYKRFLAGKKIFYILKARGNDFYKIIKTGKINPVKAFAYKMSQRIEALIDKFMSPAEASILKAILLGERGDVDDDVKDTFFNTGTIHILSISGLHVGLLTAIFLLIFKLFRVPFKFSFIGAGLLLMFYCVMVDNRPPVVRASIMIGVFLSGKILRRKQDLFNSLAFAALIILLFEPQALFNAGFQLSFLTVASILYFPPRLEGMLPKGMSKARLYALRAAIVSLSAWLGSAPLIARYFNIVSPVALIANIVIVPWMFFVLASAVTFVVFGFFSPALGLIFSQVSGAAILILLKVASGFSRFPFSFFRVKSPSWFLIAFFYIVIFLFFNRNLIRV